VHFHVSKHASTKFIIKDASVKVVDLSLAITLIFSFGFATIIMDQD
jgi:hypothetical protein